MTCPRCKCPECAKAELNAVLSRRIVARETESYGAGPAIARLPIVEAANAQALRDIREREQWHDTVEEAAHG